jgi:hypothetical protein
MELKRRLRQHGILIGFQGASGAPLFAVETRALVGPARVL